MKIKFIFLLILLTFSFNLFATDKKGEIILPRIPTSVEDFLKLRSELAKTPQSAVALLVSAMIIYSKDNSLGLKCFVIALDRSNLTDTGQTDIYKGFSINNAFMYYFKQQDKFSYLGNIYIQGTSVEKKYELPSATLKLKYVQFTTNGDKAKMYVATTSGNMPRPIELKKNNKGIWKVYAASSFFVGPSKTVKKNIINDDI